MSLFVKATINVLESKVFSKPFVRVSGYLRVLYILALKEKIKKSMIYDNNLKKIQENIDLDLAFSNF